MIEEARKYCEEHGYRFTEPRRLVLDIVAQAEAPIGAYEILHRLGQYLDNPKPPTVYRAIDFWQEHGFLHKIESLNAFMACSAGHIHKGAQVMICKDCGDTEEIHMCSIPRPLEEQASSNKFQVMHWNTELHGICSKCSGL